MVIRKRNNLIKEEGIMDSKRQKFWLSPFCDYDVDGDGKIDFVLSKGNIFCWISFIGLIVVAVSQMFGLKYEFSSLTVALDSLKTIFITTFSYSAFKKGADIYEETKTSETQNVPPTEEK